MATEAPVLLIVEIEPTETASLAVGASFRSHLTVLDADSRQPVDPDSGYPHLIKTPPFTSPTTYTLGGIGSIIVRDSVGVFHADIPITLPGNNRHQWLVTMGGISVGSNTTQLQGVAAGPY
jgi:hypothetical protein